MTYREQLNKVNELGINICDLTIANECECVWSFYYTEQEFERLCEKAKDCYLKGNSNENSIALAIEYYIQTKGKTIEQVLALSHWTILDEAQWH